MSSSTGSPFDLLLADGVIDGVIGQLKTGKEAEVYLVQHQGQVVAAKVYKERHARNFKNNAGYTEGRAVRNSRTRRAIEKGSKFGQAAAEEAWKSHEADALFKLHAQGVRVPTPVMFYEGILLMECVTDADGQPAPRLVEVAPETADDARLIYEDVRGQVVRMLASDLIHGDLSPFNILMGTQGPVIIDFPQTVAAAGNNRAEFYFRRDLDTVRGFLAGFDPRLHATAGETGEIWNAYVKRELTADFVPTGRGGGAHAGPRRHAGGPRSEGSSPRGPRPHAAGPQHPRGPRHEHTPHPASMHAPSRAAGRDRAEEAEALARSQAQGAPEGVDAAEAELRALEALVLRQGGGERGKPPPSKPPPGARRHGRGPGRPPGQASGGARPHSHGAGAGARPPQQGQGAGARPQQHGATAARPQQQGASGARPQQHDAGGARSPQSQSQGGARMPPAHGRPQHTPGAPGSAAAMQGGSPRAPHGGAPRHAASSPAQGQGPRGQGSHAGTGPRHNGRPPHASRGPGGAPSQPPHAQHGSAPQQHREGARPPPGHDGPPPQGRGPHGGGQARHAPRGPGGPRRPGSAPEVTRVARPPASPHRNGPTS